MRIISLLLVGFLLTGLGFSIFKDGLDDRNQLQAFIGTIMTYTGVCFSLIGCIAAGIVIGKSE